MSRIIRYECPECLTRHENLVDAQTCCETNCLERDFCSECNEGYAHLAGCPNAPRNDEPKIAEPVEDPAPTTFDLTCFDGTVFTLPSDHPDITAGGIGGVGYSYILEDSSRMPEQFLQYRTAEKTTDD